MSESITDSRRVSKGARELFKTFILVFPLKGLAL